MTKQVIISKLPRSAPQFFFVNITGDEKEPVARKVMNDVMKDLDFNALKNMLGK